MMDCPGSGSKDSGNQPSFVQGSRYIEVLRVANMPAMSSKP
jgi:hypothetical protein